MIDAFLSKTARTVLLFLLLGGIAGFVRQRERLGLTSEWRFAALRELARRGDAPEVLFFGSSETARGVRPDVFRARLAELGEGDVSAVNLAIMGISRPIAYLTLLDWLRDHAPPRIVFVEMSSADVAEWPHQLAADFHGPREAVRVALARPYDYESQRAWGELGDPPRFDPGGIFAAFDRIELNVRLAIGALGRGPEDLTRALWNAVRSQRAGRGFRPYWRLDPDQPEILPELLAQQLEDDGWYDIPLDTPEALRGHERLLAQAASSVAPDVRSDPFADPTRFRPAKVYAELLAELCREHGIRLVFVELPAFQQRLSPEQVAFHAELAEVLSLDPSAFDDPERFWDSGHLGPAGSEWFSKELAEWLFTHPR